MEFTLPNALFVIALSFLISVLVSGVLIKFVRRSSSSYDDMYNYARSDVEASTQLRLSTWLDDMMEKDENGHYKNSCGGRRGDIHKYCLIPYLPHSPHPVGMVVPHKHMYRLTNNRYYTFQYSYYFVCECGHREMIDKDSFWTSTLVQVREGAKAIAEAGISWAEVERQHKAYLDMFKDNQERELLNGR